MQNELRKRYPSKEKEAVKKLLLEGKTYREIKELLQVPKSTISTWFGKVIKKPMTRKALLNHLAHIRKRSSEVIKKKYEKIRAEESEVVKNDIRKELESYPFGNIGVYKSLLAMLYWAEGSRTGKVSGTKFANTDPALHLLYVTLLRKCYTIDEAKFRIRLHVHYYHSIKETKKFWSKTLQIPLNQFTKVFLKKRSATKRFRKNFAGICFIYYGNNRIRKELIELGLSLQKIIAIHAPVA